MQVDERLILGLDDRVDPAVVVEVARGQASAQVEGAERVAGPGRHVRQASVRPARQQLNGHLPGEDGLVVADMAVGRDQVEPAVIIGIEEGDAEAQQLAGRRSQAHRRGVVREQAAGPGCGRAWSTRRNSW